MIDQDKLKAALEKRRKARREITLKKDDLVDKDDLIERELEDGVELAAEDEKSKWEGRQNRSKSDNANYRRDYEEIRDGKHVGMKGQSLKEAKAEEMIDDSSTSLNMPRQMGNPRRKSDLMRVTTTNLKKISTGRGEFLMKRGTAKRRKRKVIVEKNYCVFGEGSCW